MLLPRALGNNLYFDADHSTFAILDGATDGCVEATKSTEDDISRLPPNGPVWIGPHQRRLGCCREEHLTRAHSSSSAGVLAVLFSGKTYLAVRSSGGSYAWAPMILSYYNDEAE